MRKNSSINFLKEERQEEKYFKCTVIILIYLLVFQGYTDIKYINNLKEEINIVKLTNKPTEILESKNKKSTLIKDTNKIYELLGFSNIDRLFVENNRVSIEGKCKNLQKLNELKSMDNIKNFSINSVENKNNKLYFHLVYELGGYE